MNVDKLKSLLDSYARLVGDEYSRCGGEDIGAETKTDSLCLSHIYWMIKEVRGQLDAKDPNWGKVNRWIGWIQAGLYTHDLRTVDEMRAEVTEALS